MASRVLFSPSSGDIGQTHVHMGKGGSIDVDIGKTHLHLNRPTSSSVSSTPVRAAEPIKSPIKKLNDAVNDLSNTYTRAVKSLEGAEKNHLKKEYYRNWQYDNNRSVLDVLREKLDLENDLASRSLLKSGKTSAAITTPTNETIRTSVKSNLGSSPYLNMCSPYLAKLEPSLRPYADKFLTERLAVRKMMEDGKLCNNLRVATAEANGELRNWLLEYSGMGTYTTTRMLEIAQKVQDLLQQIKAKDQAYALLDQTLASKINLIDQMKRRKESQQLSDAEQLDQLIQLTAEMQAKLKQKTSDGVERLKQEKHMESREQTLQVLMTEMTTELTASKSRLTGLAKDLTNQKAAQQLNFIAQAANFAAREQLLREKIELALEGQRRQEKLCNLLKPEKATLEATVQAARERKRETADELAQACDIANRLKEGLEQEISMAQFWQDSAQDLSRAVIGGVGAREMQILEKVGEKYVATVEGIAEAKAAIQRTERALGEIKVVAMKELVEMQEEHKRIKSLSKHLVEEKDHEKDLVSMIEITVNKFRQLRSLAILNDAKHKKNESSISMLIEQTKEDRDNDQAEMRVAVEYALKKVEEAKYIATNAKAISAVMDREIRYGY